MTDRGTSAENAAPLIKLLDMDLGREVTDEILSDKRFTQAYEREFFTSAHNWMASRDWILFKSLLKEAYNEPSPRLFFDLGQRRYSVDDGPLVTYARLFSTKNLLWAFPFLNRLMNEDQEIVVPVREKLEALVINYYFERFKPEETIDECFWTQGIISGASTLSYLPAASMKEILCSFDPVVVLNRDYAYLGFEAAVENEKVLIDGEPYLNYAPIIHSNIKKKYLQKVREEPPGMDRETTWLLGTGTKDSEIYGWHVEKDLTVNGENILQAGDVWGAPYCLYHMSWERLGMMQWMKNRVRQLLPNTNLEQRYEEALVIANRKAREARKYAADLEVQKKAVEELLNITELELQKTQELTGAVAHRANNKLTVVEKRLGLLQSESDINPIYNMMNRIEMQSFPDSERAYFGSHIDKLLHHIEESHNAARQYLDLTKRVTEYGHIIRDSKPLYFSIDQIIEHSVSESGLAIKYDNLPAAEVFADPEGIRKSLIEIYKNAAESYRQGEPEIKLRAEVIDDNVHIQITDNGEGIDKDRLHKIFFPCYTTRPEGKSTGMGLPIAQRYIEHYGGRIAIESEMGKGTKVDIWLPNESKR